MSQQTVFDRNPSLAEPAGRAAWQESFQPVLAELRAALQSRSPRQIAAVSGAAWDEAAGEFALAWLDQTFRIVWPELVVYAAGAREPSPPSTQGLFLYYLATADGTPPTGRWISFREVPNGWLYHQAFQGYTGNRLVQTLGNDLDAFVRSAQALGGAAVDLGDRGYVFRVLPAVWLAVVYWQGDEEFPPQAQVLFDDAAGHYLSTDGLASIGSRLIGRLLDQAQLPRSTE